MEHEGHWECRIKETWEPLYDACRAIQEAIDAGRGLQNAVAKVRDALAKVEEHQRDPREKPVMF